MLVEVVKLLRVGHTTTEGGVVIKLPAASGEG